MQYSVYFLAALAATGAIAAPSYRNTNLDNEARVALATTAGGGQQIQRTLDSERRDSVKLRAATKWETVELRLGEDVENEELRCQILNQHGKPVDLKRGENEANTFADGGNGEWTLQPPSKVSKITCDKKFQKQGEQEDTAGDSRDAQGTVRVALISPPADDTQIQRELQAGEEDSVQFNSQQTWAQVGLTVGDNVDPAYRCRILDPNGAAIQLKRGENRADSFADGDKGVWDLIEPSAVSEILCSPEIQNE